MPLYHVTVVRSEEITFQLDATDAADAEARYLSDGSEIFSETVGTTVTMVEVVDE